MDVGEVVNGFLSKAYDRAGLKILNDAAVNVPAVRYAGAVLIVMMFGAAGLYLYQGNLGLLVVTVSIIVVIGFLLIVLGGAATQEHTGQAQFISWVIVVAFSISAAMVVVVIPSSFLFGWPRPIGEILVTRRSNISLDGVSIAIEEDDGGNLVLTTKGVPRQPYSLGVDVRDPDTGERVGYIELPLPNRRNAIDPSGTVEIAALMDQVECVLNLRNGQDTIQSRKIPVEVAKGQ